MTCNCNCPHKKQLSPELLEKIKDLPINKQLTEAYIKSKEEKGKE